MGTEYKIITRKEAINAYFDGKAVYMIDVYNETIEILPSLMVKDLLEDSDTCYLIKEDKANEMECKC